MMLRVTIGGIAASWTRDGGWRCSDDLLNRTLLAACEPDTEHAHEATALARAVRHFSGIDTRVVEVVELVTEDEDAAIVAQRIIRMMDPRHEGAPLPSDALRLAEQQSPFIAEARLGPMPGDAFERDLMRAEQSRQENARASLAAFIARRQERSA